MAGYSKGIVDTRKLNKNSKAKLGRGGDTKIREVDNRESHVNALEAYLIDVNGKAGEDYAKRVGAGTVNPLTGMPEYWDPLGDITDWAYETFAVPYVTEKAEESFKEMGSDIYDVYGGARGRLDYDTAKDMSQTELQNYLYQEFDVSKDQMKYIEGFQEEPFGFLGEEKATGLKGQFLKQRQLQSGAGFAQEGTELTRDLALGGLGTQEAQLGLQREGLGLKRRGFDIQKEGLTAQQAALGRQMGRGFGQATGAAATAVSRSGLATSGTITSGLEEQKRELFQDFTEGTKDIGLSREMAGADYETAIAGAGLDFTKGTYAEKQRQLDEYWDMIGIRQAAG